jgi:hypothetical protein
VIFFFGIIKQEKKKSKIAQKNKSVIPAETPSEEEEKTPVRPNHGMRK